MLNAVSPLAYLLNHRGLTHSLVALPLWALLLAWIASWMFRPRRRFTAWLALSALGLAAHIAGDLITSFGTMVFAPLSNVRYAWGTTFIIDLWFTGIILAGVLGSLLWRRSRVPALAATLVLAGYVGFQAVQQDRARGVGEQLARNFGEPDWNVSVQPGPVSPFNWVVFLERDGRYRYALIDLAATEVAPDPGPQVGLISRLAAAFRPASQPDWREASRLGDSPDDVRLARSAWDASALGFFRWFARYPALYRIDRGNPSQCVWFYDLRFFRPGTEFLPFRFGACRENDGPWRRYQLSGESQRVPLD